MANRTYKREKRLGLLFLIITFLLGSAVWLKLILMNTCAAPAHRARALHLAATAAPLGTLFAVRPFRRAFAWQSERAAAPHAALRARHRRTRQVPCRCESHHRGQPLGLHLPGPAGAAAACPGAARRPHRCPAPAQVRREQRDRRGERDARQDPDARVRPLLHALRLGRLHHLVAGAADQPPTPAPPLARLPLVPLLSPPRSPPARRPTTWT